MKTKLLIIGCSLIGTIAFAQTDSSERKMRPPDYSTEPPKDSDKSLIQDTAKVVPDKTSVKQNEVQPVAKPEDTKSIQKPVHHRTVKNGFVVKNGKVMKLENGQASSVVETVSLTNGNRLMMDGKVYKKDGTWTKLNEGDFIDYSGNITTQWPTDNNDQRPSELQKSNPKTSQPVQPADKSMEPRKNDDKNMYLVPDSTLKDNKKQSPK